MDPEKATEELSTVMQSIKITADAIRAKEVSISIMNADLNLLQAERKQDLEKLRRYQIESTKLKHLSEGLCSASVVSGGTWSSSTKYCTRPGKYACEACGSKTCGNHHKTHRCPRDL